MTTAVGTPSWKPNFPFGEGNGRKHTRHGQSPKTRSMRGMAETHMTWEITENTSDEETVENTEDIGNHWKSVKTHQTRETVENTGDVENR